MDVVLPRCSRADSCLGRNVIRFELSQATHLELVIKQQEQEHEQEEQEEQEEEEQEQEQEQEQELY